MEPEQLDLATLAALSGDAAARVVRSRLGDAGHGAMRTAHGYVIQRLLVGEPTIGELAESLAMTQQGASKHVAELERLGYVDRVPDPGDSRARRVRLTPTARDAIETARAARGALESALASRFGADDLAAARRVLAGLIDLAGESDLVRRRAMPMP